MKRIIAVFLSLLALQPAYTQFFKDSPIYSSGELNIGNYVGINFDLNTIYKDKYSFKIGITSNVRKAKSRPDDYQNGFLKEMFLFGITRPYDFFANYQIAVGRVYQLNEKGTLRANLALGLGYSIVEEPENWEKVEDIFIIDNYKWDNRKRKALCFTINPKLEIPFTRYYGFTVSPMVQFNKHRVYYGIGIGHMFGRLMKK